jgi:uncharacterized protein YbdZ (MbtH family)
VDRLLGEWGIRWDQPGAGREFSALMEARRQAELEQEFKALPRGWCVGSEAFRAEMLQYIEEQRGKWHYVSELSESAQAKAERLIAEALRAGGVTEGQLATWRKGHPFKVNRGQAPGGDHGHGQLDCAAAGDGNPRAFGALALSQGRVSAYAFTVPSTDSQYMTLSLTDTFSLRHPVASGD